MFLYNYLNFDAYSLIITIIFAVQLYIVDSSISEIQFKRTPDISAPEYLHLNDRVAVLLQISELTLRTHQQFCVAACGNEDISGW